MLGDWLEQFDEVKKGRECILPLTHYHGYFFPFLPFAFQKWGSARCFFGDHAAWKSRITFSVGAEGPVSGCGAAG